MNHYVLRGADWAPLFATWEEAALLWEVLVQRVPGATAMCLMPDHVHLLHRADVAAQIGAAMRGFARGRNARREELGRCVWAPLGPPTVAKGGKIRRDIRYIHLNPCRKGLVQDPLAWPWSTHRDALGMVVRPVRAQHGDPQWLHHYVSGDPTVSAGGTPLPLDTGEPIPLDRLAAACSSVTRALPHQLLHRGPARSLAVRAARHLTQASVAEIAAWAAVDARTVYRLSGPPNPHTRLVGRVAHDRRFGALQGPMPRNGRRHMPFFCG